ncbi:hypothetical protein RJT34_16926 [Clitoria ternatea]|uniref:BHLH domain-containing protein n=1 Tax=Clitoria ternatea TaxID=43366 RepID=A0AAN9JA50_CLITE
MGDPCQKFWFSDMEIQDDDFFNQHHKINTLEDADQIFREIMHQRAFSSDSQTICFDTQNKPIIDDCSTVANKCHSNLVIKNNGSNFMFSTTQHAPDQKLLPATTTSSTSYILSFDDSTVVAATPQTYTGKQPYHEEVVVASGGTCPPSKGALEKQHGEPMAIQKKRKGRSSTETLDHIMTERKRRRELTERFIALSATIPGLKKIDKATILSEAISHVKQLKERVRELEEQRKKTLVESVSFIHKKSQNATDRGNTSSIVTVKNCDDDDYCYKINEALPTVEARVFKNDVLLRIHCMIQSGILLKILSHLETLDLFTISNSVMPFGSSTLDISIIAQMGEKFSVTMNDLVKNLRLAILEPSEVQQ